MAPYGVPGAGEPEIDLVAYVRAFDAYLAARHDPDEQERQRKIMQALIQPKKDARRPGFRGAVRRPLI